MPRMQKLSQLVPNKVYSVKGRLIYKHEAQTFTTAIIEQCGTQKKIKIPKKQQQHFEINDQEDQMKINQQKNEELRLQRFQPDSESIDFAAQQLKEGQFYHFKNCFYNSSGWLSARNPQKTIKQIKHVQQQDQPQQERKVDRSKKIIVEEAASSSLKINDNYSHIQSLSQLQQTISNLSTEISYFTTHVYIYGIDAKTTVNKNGKDLTFQMLKCYANNMIVDLTIWNQEIQVSKQEFLNKFVALEGFRAKRLVGNKFVLVSSVFSKISVLEELTTQMKSEKPFDSNILQKYENLSDIYERRDLRVLQKMQIPKEKVFSNIKAKVKSIVKADYQGCIKCRRKNGGACQFCNLSAELTYDYGKVILQQDSSKIQVIVFDEKIKGLFKYAKQGCFIEGKLKTFSRVEDGEVLISHILTKVDSIFFQ